MLRNYTGREQQTGGRTNRTGTDKFLIRSVPGVADDVIRLHYANPYCIACAELHNIEIKQIDREQFIVRKSLNEFVLWKIYLNGTHI